MKTISARNVNQAFPKVLEHFREHGVLDEGYRVVWLPEPLTLTILMPHERILFAPQVQANPFILLLESMWMLLGRNDVSFLAFLAPELAEFSDDGFILEGAYGYRWRHHFGFDQLEVIANRLQKEPRVPLPLSIVDPYKDLTDNMDSRNLPHVTHIYLSRNQCLGVVGQLDMTVCSDSSEVIQDALCSDVVFLSFLQEFLAAKIGCPIGSYRHVIQSGFLNERNYKKLIVETPSLVTVFDPYTTGAVKPQRLLAHGGYTLEDFTNSLEMLIDLGALPLGQSCFFIRKIVSPMLAARQAMLACNEGIGQFQAAHDIVENQMPPKCDWLLAIMKYLKNAHAEWVKGYEKEQEKRRKEDEEKDLPNLPNP